MLLQDRKSISVLEAFLLAIEIEIGILHFFIGRQPLAPANRVKSEREFIFVIGLTVVSVRTGQQKAPP